MEKPISSISNTRLEVIDSLSKLKKDRNIIERGIKNLYGDDPDIIFVQFDIDKELGYSFPKSFHIKKDSWQLPLVKNFFYQMLAECDRKIEKNIKLLNK
jgi:hypothetical protein